MSNTTKRWITIKVSKLEMLTIETYCKHCQRTKTDKLRELIRSLPTYGSSSILATLPETSNSDPTAQSVAEEFEFD
jgi:hypothetical protein